MTKVTFCHEWGLCRKKKRNGQGLSLRGAAHFSVVTAKRRRVAKWPWLTAIAASTRAKNSMYCLYAWFGSAAFGKRHIAHLQRRAQGFKAVYFSAPHSFDRFQMQGKGMQTKFSQFLRFGGSGAFIVRRKGDAWIGTKIRVSTKSEFPNYAALRENFGARLDGIIKANTATLLQAVTEKYAPPLTEKDLPSVDDSRDETLSLWEERIEVIWDEWHSHPQRLHPVREAMEQHLLRGFAALTNELRQRALGIRQYVAISR